jgi:NADH:ubiquinone oxidoreductase subunit C
MKLKTKALNKMVPFLISQEFNNTEFCLVILASNLLLSLHFLKKHIGCQYNLLSCVSGVDLLKSKFRFLVSYEFLNIVFNNKIRVKMFVDEYNAIPSATSLYINSNWWEREIWDLYGIFFDNNIDLRRILTDYGFEGYPLRKDFPLSGFYELLFSINFGRVASVSTFLAQEYRLYNSESVW